MKHSLRLRSVQALRPRSVQAWLLPLAVLTILMLVLAVACGGPTPAPTPVPATPTSPPPTDTPVPPPPTDTPAPPPPAPTATPAPPVVEIPPVPIGKERRARDWDADVADLLFSRRTAASDLVGGLGGIAFDPTDCMRCHENASDVEGQIFYGPEFKEFDKDQWLEMLSRPEEGLAPAADYDFIETHEKRVDLLFDVFPEQQIKQNP
ncbi:MAG: hypothetical protein ACE5LU_17750 [Anaerolineae bacterium]